MSAILDALAAAGAPEYMLAVLEALQFQNSCTERIQALTGEEWQKLMSWCDARQLTLTLPYVCGDALPTSVRERIERNRKAYGERFARLNTEFREVCDELNRVGLEFVLLKGATHSPAFSPDPFMRVQGDIDLWLRGDSAYEAQKRLAAMGYFAISPSKSRHLPTMARPVNCVWRGDFLASDLPVSFELHYELWSEKTEYIPVRGQEAFWPRKIRRTIENRSVQVLCDQDLFGFAALHLLLHVLHGDRPLQRAWEIGNFLHQRRRDDEFWQVWREAHGSTLRQMEALVSTLVSVWFGCALPEAIEQEAVNLPENVRGWINRFSLSPLKAQFHPNKDELWLHTALIPRLGAKTKVFLRRLVPTDIPRAFILSRFAHHARTFFPTIIQGVRSIWLRRSSLP